MKLSAPQYKPNTRELIAVAVELEAGGHPVAGLGGRAEAVYTAIATPDELTPDTYFGDDGLLAAGPDEARRRVAQLAAAVSARAGLPTAGTEALDRLGADIAAALRSPAVVDAMKPRFDAALEVVRTAADCGVTGDTDAASVVAGGDARQLDAYRAVTAAAEELDQIAAVRAQLTAMCGAGPRDHPSAAFLAVGSTWADLEAAASLDDVETVEVTEHPIWHHPVTRSVRVHRCGGRWLAWTIAGFELTLNTGDEAFAVVAEAGRLTAAERAAEADAAEADAAAVAS